jgi:hypothetical protein
MRTEFTRSGHKKTRRDASADEHEERTKTAFGGPPGPTEHETNRGIDASDSKTFNLF